MNNCTQRRFPAVCSEVAALSTCALVAAGCGPGSMSQNPARECTSPPSMAELDQINRINSALAARPQTSSPTADYRLPPRLVRSTLTTFPESEAGVTPRKVEVGEPGGHDHVPLLMDVRAEGDRYSLRAGVAGAVR